MLPDPNLYDSRWRRSDHFCPQGSAERTYWKWCDRCFNIMVWNWIENVYSLKKCLEMWLLFDKFEFCVTLLKFCPHTWFWVNKEKLWHHPDFSHIALFRKQYLWNKCIHQPVIQFCSYLVTWDLHNSHTRHCRLFTKFAFIHQIMCY